MASKEANNSLREIRHLTDKRVKVLGDSISSTNGEPQTRFEEPDGSFSYQVLPRKTQGTEYVVTFRDLPPSLDGRARELRFFTYPRYRLLDLIIRGASGGMRFKTHVRPFEDPERDPSQTHLTDMIRALQSITDRPETKS